MSANGDNMPRHRPSGVTNREERLEAELRANLRRRKDQARARSRAGIDASKGAEKTSNSKRSSEDDGC
jgi:hypothetical protein